MPLRGEPDSRHPQQKQAPHRGPRPPSPARSAASAPVPRLPSLVSRPRRTAKRMRPSLVPSVRSEASARRPPSLVPPPQRPSRRQCRSAASRTAGTLNRSRHPTGDPRPPSPARSAAPAPVLGKVQEGAEAPSWFPPPAERIGIIFRHGVYVTKNPSHEATCEKGPARKGLDPFCAKAECGIIDPAPPKGRWIGISSPKCSSVHLGEILYSSSTWNTPSMAMMSRRRPSTVCLRSMRMVKMAQALCFSLPLERVISRFTTLSPSSR